ncbi:GNAT family N-acetyltransferase [Streptococcus ovuberis]|uniref:GNAT family N-acetyltransferase n=1 Tax=Streptococcus ovuberis TaxID=1936207 RepID=A0A7X6S223_9STRE|nr:GNAT family N-acetyltransferase [Streptococcus ovuberis]NKZ20791.1 GNAT family N-acetyltransferase [Streptococcus ovuberis]
MPIRPASPSDIPDILSLLDQILKVHHQARPDLFESQGTKFTHQELLALLEQPDKPIFVYEDHQGKVLGHLFLEIRTPSHPVRKPVKSCFIEDLCVSEQARGLGIGRKFYCFAKDYAKSQNCYNLTLNVWNANQTATDFYRKLGLTPQQTQMEEILD